MKFKIKIIKRDAQNVGNHSIFRKILLYCCKYNIVFTTGISGNKNVVFLTAYMHMAGLYGTASKQQSVGTGEYNVRCAAIFRQRILKTI